MKKNSNNISKLCSAYCFAHLHSASTHHSSPVKWVGADTISFLSLCGGFPFPTPARPSPRRRANTQTNSRGAFHGTIPASAGLWSHSGLTTVVTAAVTALRLYINVIRISMILRCTLVQYIFRLFSCFPFAARCRL